MKVVVDACVGIKWFVAEQLIDEADRLHLIWPQLIVPSLFLLEISNIAFRKAVAGEITETVASQIPPWLRQSGLRVEDSDDFIDHALEIAFELRHPVYDCIYAALAERYAGMVISDDRTFLKKLEGSRFAHLAISLVDVDWLIERPD